MKDTDKLAVIVAGSAIILFFLLRGRVQADTDTGLSPSDLRTSPTYPIVGQFITISIVLENITEETIDYRLQMWLNGADLGTSYRDLEPGERREPAWNVTEMITQPGIYTAEAELTNLGTGVSQHFSMEFEVFTEYP